VRGQVKILILARTLISPIDRNVGLHAMEFNVAKYIECLFKLMPSDFQTCL